MRRVRPSQEVKCKGTQEKAWPRLNQIPLMDEGETIMKVTTISASVRYSRAINTGEYKTIELCAEATLEPNETWTEAQAALYQDLGQQLRTLWTVKNGQATNGSAKAEGSITEQSDHYCQEHQTEFKRYEKDGRTWYAHKAGSKWCRQK